MKMKIYISNDHRGVGLKIYLAEMLGADGYEVENLGCDDPNTPADFPVITKLATDKLLKDTEARAIVICGTGAGAVIAANRFRHIRATRCERPDQATADRFHDDVNLLAFGADDVDPEQAFLTAKAFLESPFDAAERRIRRLKEIS
ncbi:MAG: RpiB/LacA/LacB family sugar-phosphate isomerase [Rickettsiales bacterium]|jgi:ribose 5-phosphate isomerase B|nr:RpiB/LacA/LacB family sugar-phosphate isomerase [Rickettsiales bacterium]